VQMHVHAHETVRPLVTQCNARLLVAAMGVSAEEYAKFLRITLQAITDKGRLASVDGVRYVDVNGKMKGVSLSQAAVLRDKAYQEELKRIRRLFREPKIPVHVSGRPLLLSREQYGRPRPHPRAGVWNGMPLALDARRDAQSGLRPYTVSSGSFRPDRRFDVRPAALRRVLAHPTPLWLSSSCSSLVGRRT